MWAIRAQTADGAEQVDFMLALFRGHVKGARLRDRMDAATWLADRGFGKPVQQMEHSGRDGDPLVPLALLQQLIMESEHDNGARPGD